MHTWCNKNLIFSWPWKKIHFNKVLQSQRRRDKTKVAAWLWQWIINFPPGTSLFSLSFTLTFVYEKVKPADWTSELSSILPHLILRNVNSFPVSMFLTMDRAWRDKYFSFEQNKTNYVFCWLLSNLLGDTRNQGRILNCLRRVHWGFHRYPWQEPIIKTSKPFSAQVKVKVASRVEDWVTILSITNPSPQYWTFRVNNNRSQNTSMLAQSLESFLQLMAL